MGMTSSGGAPEAPDAVHFTHVGMVTGSGMRVFLYECVRDEDWSSARDTHVLSIGSA